MSFGYINRRLHCSGLDLHKAAEDFGTPAYIYSDTVLRRNAQVLKSAFVDRGIQVSYAMKSNPNPYILTLFKSYGFGLDIVSGGELEMGLHAGFSGADMNFAGVGKNPQEIRLALNHRVGYFNVESLFELKLLEQAAAELDVQTSVLLRLNPDIDPQTHPHISTGLKNNKFGMAPELVESLLTDQQDYPHLNFKGIHCHIGSQILKPQPFTDLIAYLVGFIKELRTRNVQVEHLDLGGGFGVNYQDPFEDILTTTPYLESFAEQAVHHFPDIQLHVQPGRVLTANTAVLLSRVLGTKENGDHYFVVGDAATTDLIRPALYDAYHAIYPCVQAEGVRVGDVVGPVCESSDALARHRLLPEFAEGDLMAIASAGAYGSAMGSTYNLRPLSPEILVDDAGEMTLIRRRQTFDEMIALYK